MARFFHRRAEMPMRHGLRLRALFSTALLASLLPFGLASGATAPGVPARCGTSSPPPACPACPSEGRPCCPAPQPARARTCCVPAALPPGASERECRPARSGTEASAAPAEPGSAVERTAAGRRAVVAGASPPVRLLACTFRN